MAKGFMQMQVYKGEGWIVETDDGNVVLYDVNSLDVEILRSCIGSERRCTVGDLHARIEAVTTVRGYFGRYSAPGYLDCTPWEYDTNRRRLERTLRADYGPQ